MNTLDVETLQNPTRSLNALTFSRFVAAIAIVLHHSIGLFALPKQLEQLNLGLAVSFFFVLSGFILKHVHPEIANSRDAYIFWRARFARCYPLHLVILLAFGFLYPYGMGYDPSGHPRFDTFFANLFLTQAWFASPSFFFAFNSPSWSVSVEFFFYLCYPILVCSRDRITALKILYSALAISFVIASCCAYLEQTLHGQSVRTWVGYINPLSRLFEFVFGIFCAAKFGPNVMAMSNRKASLLQFLSIVSVVITMSLMPEISRAFYQLRFVPEQVVFALLWGLVIVSFASNAGCLARALNNPIFIKLGEVSFSIYMLHELVKNAFEPFWLSQCHHNRYFALATYFVTVIVCSVVVHECVERPARKMLMTLNCSKC